MNIREVSPLASNNTEQSNNFIWLKHHLSHQIKLFFFMVQYNPMPATKNKWQK